MKPCFAPTLLLSVWLLSCVATDQHQQTDSAAAEINRSTTTKLYPGDRLPVFHLTTVTGQQFSPQSLRGKVVLLNIFHTLCRPCVEELQELERFWQDQQRDDLVILAIGRKNTETEVLALVNELGIDFPVAADPENKVCSSFATLFVPRSYVVDRSGLIVAYATSYDQESYKQLTSAVHQLLER